MAGANFTHVCTDGNTFVHDLVENGLVSILKGVLPLVMELSERLKDAEWCDKQKLASSKASIINVYPDAIGRGARSLSPESTQPLLLVACRSEQPNMATGRFLVEEIGCDVNFQGYLRASIPTTPTGFGICNHVTPIHALFRGKTHWWQPSEALPYLVQDHGASLEIRNCFHSTPLIVASAHIGWPSFDRQGLDRLIEFGADVKAVDLAWAWNSAEMTDLVLCKGAVMKPAAMLAAVRSRNCDVLRVVVAHGADVNSRETRILGEEPKALQQKPIYIGTSVPPPEKVPVTEFHRYLRGQPSQPLRDAKTPATPGPFVPEGEMYPLDFAAHLGRGDYEVPYVYQIPPDELEKVIETLIELGADVIAKYEGPDGTRMSIKEKNLPTRFEL